MSLDTLLKATRAFKEGISEFQTEQAVNDAREQLNQLTYDEKNKGAFLQQQAKVANDLALRLTAAHAAPQVIAQATSGLLAPASVTQTNEAQAQMQAQSEKFKAVENQLNRESAEKIAGIRSTGANDMRKSAQEVRFLKDVQQQFNTAAKKPIDALNQINVAKEVVSTGNPIGDKSVTNFLARASGEVGALTEADKAPFGGSQALDQKLAQATENMKSGKFTPANRELVKNLLDTFEKVNKANIEKIRQQHAKRAMVSVDKGRFNINESDLIQSMGGEASSSPASGSAARVVAKKFYSPSQNKTKLVYTDGSEDILDGQH